MLQDADVAKLLLAHTFKQCAHAWLMHLAAQKIVFRPYSRDMRSGVTHAKPNFQDQRSRSTKHLFRVQGLLLKRQNKTRPQFCQSLGLTRGGATGAGDKTLDGFGVGDVGRRGGHGHVVACADYLPQISSPAQCVRACSQVP